MNPREALEAAAPTQEDRVVVVVAGERYLCRTRLRVEDVLALPANMFSMHAFAANCILFRILGLAPNGMAFIEDGPAGDWYMQLDALQIHKGMAEAGVLRRITEQLAPAGEEAAQGAGKR